MQRKLPVSISCLMNPCIGTADAASSGTEHLLSSTAGTASSVRAELQSMAVCGAAVARTTLKPGLGTADDGTAVFISAEPELMAEGDGNATGTTIEPGLGAIDRGTAFCVCTDLELMWEHDDDGDDAIDLLDEHVWQLKKFSSVVVKPQVLHLNAPNCDQTDPLPSPKAVTLGLFTPSPVLVFFLFCPLFGVTSGDNALLL